MGKNRNRNVSVLWFHNDINYEKSPLTKVDYIVKSYQLLTEQDNLLVINLPPNKQGKLVKADVENLYQASELLKIKRKI